MLQNKPIAENPATPRVEIELEQLDLEGGEGTHTYDLFGVQR